VADLQPDLFFRFGGHSGTEPKLREFHYLLHLPVSRPTAEIIAQFRVFAQIYAVCVSEFVRNSRGHKTVTENPEILLAEVPIKPREIAACNSTERSLFAG
jgi:hypothetical protein